MKHTIEDLWNGNITSAEKCGVGDPEIENLIILMDRHRELLCKKLGQTHRDIFEKYTDCSEEYVCLISKCAFTEGFCLGCKLMAEALSQNS